jgi:hypothetical protein
MVSCLPKLNPDYGLKPLFLPIYSIKVYLNNSVSLDSRGFFGRAMTEVESTNLSTLLLGNYVSPEDLTWPGLL